MNALSRRPNIETPDTPLAFVEPPASLLADAPARRRGRRRNKQSFDDAPPLEASLAEVGRWWWGCGVRTLDDVASLDANSFANLCDDFCARPYAVSVAILVALLDADTVSNGGRERRGFRAAPVIASWIERASTAHAPYLPADSGPELSSRLATELIRRLPLWPGDERPVMDEASLRERLNASESLLTYRTALIDWQVLDDPYMIADVFAYDQHPLANRAQMRRGVRTSSGLTGGYDSFLDYCVDGSESSVRGVELLGFYRAALRIGDTESAMRVLGEAAGNDLVGDMARAGMTSEESLGAIHLTRSGRVRAALILAVGVDHEAEARIAPGLPVIPPDAVLPPLAALAAGRGAVGQSADRGSAGNGGTTENSADSPPATSARR